MGVWSDCWYKTNEGRMNHVFESQDEYYDNNTCRYPSMFWDSLNNTMDTCRYRHKGKPISSWGRLRDCTNGDIGLYIGYGNDLLWSVSRDNIVTFHQDSEHAGGQTTVSSMGRWFPVILSRRGQNDYRVMFGWDMYRNTLAYRQGDNWKQLEKESPYIFNGLQYDLNDSKFLNAKPIDKTIEFPEKRKEWRSLLTRYKKLMKSNVVIGMFDKVGNSLDLDNIDKINHQFRWGGVPFYREDIADYVTTCMRNNEITDELMMMIHYNLRADRGRYYVKDVYTMEKSDIERFFTWYGFAFKEQLGVFKHIGYKHLRGKQHTLTKKKDTDISLEDILGMFKQKEKDDE